MRVLMVHNFYQQKGGEDVVFAEETKMLQANGHEVFQYTAHNDDLTDKSLPTIAMNMLWSFSHKQRLKRIINEVKPNIVHFHNTFMSISPAAYYACKEADLPVIQTLHNYRMLCPKGTLYRDGEICEACIDRNSYLPSINYGCYRNSRIHTTGVATMLNLHNALATWNKQVDKYICLSENSRRIFAKSAIEPHKLVVKGNFLQHDPGFVSADDRYFVFLGRLTSEKGVRTLVEAWSHLDDIPLKILGVGDLQDEILDFIEKRQMTNVEVLGHLPREKALSIVQRASAQVVPSQWHEPFGLVAIEALACGTPVIASAIGALSEIVDHGVTGLLFTPRDTISLVEQVRYLWENPDKRKQLGKMGRKVYENSYTSDVNYQQLIKIYQSVLPSNQN